MSHDTLRRRLALATAICLTTVAALMPGAPAPAEAQGCGVPAWAPAWLASLDADC